MTADELSDLESTLIAVKHRLRKLGQDIAETERTRIRAVQRIGELLGEGRPGDYDRALLGNTNIGKNQQCLSQAEREHRHQARLLAQYPEVVDEALAQSKLQPEQGGQPVQAAARRR